MKILKNDTRYIIKKIIIGVGIALILAFLKNNNVFADELTSICYDSNNNNIITSCNNSPYDTSTNYDIKMENFGLKFVPNLSSGYYLYQFAFYNSDHNIYHFLSFNFDTTGSFLGQFGYIYNYFVPNYYSFNYYLNSLSVWTTIGTEYFVVESNTSDYYWLIDNLNDISYSQFTIMIGNKPYTIIRNFNFSDRLGLTYNLINPNTWTYYYNNTTSNLNLSYEINNNDGTSSIFPELDNKKEISLKNNQAVYFVPKNYQTIEKTTIDNIDFINFSFQYKGTLKHGFFNISNNNELVFNYSPQSILSSNDYTSFDIDFPLYYDNNSQDLNSIIFFNQNQANSSIKFDDTLFDYYIINDMSNYKNNINIIDTNGNSQSLNINFYKTIDEMWQEGLVVDSDYWLSGFQNNGYQNNLNAYFDLLTIPFQWLRGLSRDKCSSISLPLPFVNSSITLQCLSSKFKSVLGNNFYNIIFYIITGLLAYRITIHNIDTLTDILNPSDDKLEVVEL